MITGEKIREIVCGYFDTTVEEINKKKRHGEVVIAKMFLTYFCLEYWEVDKKKISALTSRDRSCVYNDISKISHDIMCSVVMQKHEDNIRRLIENNLLESQVMQIDVKKFTDSHIKHLRDALLSTASNNKINHRASIQIETEIERRL